MADKDDVYLQAEQLGLEVQISTKSGDKNNGRFNPRPTKESITMSARGTHATQETHETATPAEQAVDAAAGRNERHVTEARFSRFENEVSCDHANLHTKVDSIEGDVRQHARRLDAVEGRLGLDPKKTTTRTVIIALLKTAAVATSWALFTAGVARYTTKKTMASAAAAAAIPMPSVGA